MLSLSKLAEIPIVLHRPIPDDATIKRRDFLHRLSAYYAREYDLVAVEDLDVNGMLESPRNSRNTASAAWHTFRRVLEYKCEREGTHFVPVDPDGTTKACEVWRRDGQVGVGP